MTTQGERGPQGDQGETGEIGATGTTGLQGPPVLTRRQVLAMFLFIVLAFAAVAYRTEAVLNEAKGQNDNIERLVLVTKDQNSDIERVLEVTKNAAVGHQEAAEELIDCNTPGGDCFQQQQRQVRALEARIALSRQETIVAAFICNDRPGGQQLETLSACVNDLLKRSGP